MKLSTVIPGCLLLCATGTATPAVGELSLMDCLIEPEMTVELTSSTQGIIAAVNVDQADTVSKGQVLVQLEASLEQAAADLAREKVARDDVIRTKRVMAQFAARKQQQYHSLFERKAISAHKKDEVDTEALLARLALEQAQNDQRMAARELARTEAALALRTLRSPIDGVVVERYLNPGESVEDRPVLKLAKIDPLKVELIAPVELFGQIRVGMSADILAEVPNQGRHRARVKIVDRLIDSASGTFGVRLSLPNSEYRIVGGLKCKADFSVN